MSILCNNNEWEKLLDKLLDKDSAITISSKNKKKQYYHWE